MGYLGRGSSGENKMAYDILHVLAYLDNQQIPLQLILEAARLTERTPVELRAVDSDALFSLRDIAVAAIGLEPPALHQKKFAMDEGSQGRMADSKEGKHLFDTTKGGHYEVFKERPLQIAVAAGKVSGPWGGHMLESMRDDRFDDYWVLSVVGGCTEFNLRLHTVQDKESVRARQQGSQTRAREQPPYNSLVAEPHFDTHFVASHTESLLGYMCHILEPLLDSEPKQLDGNELGISDSAPPALFDDVMTRTIELAAKLHLTNRRCI
ncbi:uncharacterized protein PG986_015000 [Apiospora aurea]|uniref:Uncharacterized protein n=1 Tax=Apiospora aurea TaxID=335848 RepID=A0ABR1PUK3_9PEZI